MGISLSTKRLLFIILAAGFVFRIVLFGIFHNNEIFVIENDSTGYLTLAENLRLGNGFSQQTVAPFAPDPFRTPGYPVFLLINRVLTGTYQSAILVQGILVVLTAWLVALIGFRMGYRRVAVGAALIFLCMPFSLMDSLKYLMQPVFSFTLILAVWWWLNYAENKKKPYLWGVALLLPLAALQRPIAIWLPAVFLIGLALMEWRNSSFAWRSWIKTAAIVIGVFAVVLAPWCYRNYREFGSYSLSSIRAFQLYFYDVPPVLALARHSSYSDARDFLERDIKNYLTISNPTEYQNFNSAPILNERSLFYIKQYPLAAATSRIPLLVSFFTRDGIRYWFQYFNPAAISANSLVFLAAVIAERLVLAFITLGFIIASIQFFRRKNHASVGMIIVVIAYFAVLSGGVSSAGLRIVVEPLIILTGFIGWQDIYKNIGLRLHSR
ncbi:MAG: hypothetical protein A3A33_01675 [Candidatus Yanofskybacteria bacterium RIFCSPLOWO2_01_FULL_49_25]|uniref:Uncharacterized protein n=1 Tax=Candidatus Yanofskybacteria bacterium RIFCSPLOWO2_01_FULL_49_25 TaxID=1802701 RepID=A0A1F8GX91_9BACT|nr:MAG: hypothetical protein A3A33_01675 [Candidatus Yanofskybacteria bacterium RIFCSPLOWO2_01_FULL_49_25]